MSTLADRLSRAERHRKIQQLEQDQDLTNKSFQSVASSTGSRHGTISDETEASLPRAAQGQGPSPGNTFTVDGFDLDNSSIYASTGILDHRSKLAPGTPAAKVPELRDTAKKYGRWSPRREPDIAVDSSALDRAFPDFTQAGPSDLSNKENLSNTSRTVSAKPSSRFHTKSASTVERRVLAEVQTVELTNTSTTGNDRPASAKKSSILKSSRFSRPRTSSQPNPQEELSILAANRTTQTFCIPQESAPRTETMGGSIPLLTRDGKVEAPPKKRSRGPIDGIVIPDTEEEIYRLIQSLHSKIHRLETVNTDLIHSHRDSVVESRHSHRESAVESRDSGIGSRDSSDGPAERENEQLRTKMYAIEKENATLLARFDSTNRELMLLREEVRMMEIQRQRLDLQTADYKNRCETRSTRSNSEIKQTNVEVNQLLSEVQSLKARMAQLERDNQRLEEDNSILIQEVQNKTQHIDDNMTSAYLIDDIHAVQDADEYTDFHQDENRAGSPDRSIHNQTEETRMSERDLTRQNRTQETQLSQPDVPTRIVNNRTQENHISQSDYRARTVQNLESRTQEIHATQSEHATRLFHDERAPSPAISEHNIRQNHSARRTVIGQLCKHAGGTCTICLRLSTFQTPGQVKQTVKVSKVVPVSLTRSNDEDQTQRPAQPPGRALAGVIRCLKDELKHLKEKHMAATVALHGLDPDRDERLYKAHMREVVKFQEMSAMKSKQIYDLNDVAEGQLEAGQLLDTSFDMTVVGRVAPDLDWTALDLEPDHI